jgi:hypothetical protein
MGREGSGGEQFEQLDQKDQIKPLVKDQTEPIYN